ncbi:unnamed protein product [Oppiella nova]|uniref:Uncharacterized protein n=1 Tax=Oppiella nova TaxID=334625 RepID=A0A7R9MRA2_9ACAR|nr:unnamed protein product [Oppiella nova]CAG2181904.1 unnamed protein product [Oppiella nova]
MKVLVLVLVLATIAMVSAQYYYGSPYAGYGASPYYSAGYASVPAYTHGGYYGNVASYGYPGGYGYSTFYKK